VVTGTLVNAPVNNLVSLPPSISSEPDVESFTPKTEEVVTPWATMVWKTGLAPNTEIWGNPIPIKPSGGNSAREKPVEYWLAAPTV